MNNKFVNRLFVSALVVSSTMLSLVPPARADGAGCAVGLIRVYDCWTSAVQANPNSHHIHIVVSPNMTYEVVDVANGVVIAHGATGWGFGVDRTILGLYSKYRLHIWNLTTSLLIGGSGGISNE